MPTKIVQINTTCGVGSTGKIAVSISELLTDRGIENNILFSTATNGYGLGIACGKPGNIKLQALKSRILGNYGFNSHAETKRIIAELERLSPSVVLLHNLHGHDCNLEMLFSYFRQKQTKFGRSMTAGHLLAIVHISPMRNVTGGKTHVTTPHSENSIAGSSIEARCFMNERNNCFPVWI